MTDAQAASLINIDLGSATALTIPNVPSGGRGTGSVTVTAGSNSFILINNTLEIEDFVERFPAENRNATTVGFGRSEAATWQTRLRGVAYSTSIQRF